MNYENEGIDDICENAEVLDKKLGFIFHQQTINAISDSYHFPLFVREKL